VPEKTQSPSPRSWAQLRFAVVAPLLASPPRPGQLHTALEELAARLWVHPHSGAPVRFGQATIERWYYRARRAADPMTALSRKVRNDLGSFEALRAAQQEILRAQYRAHPGWSVQLHTDNLGEQTRQDSDLGVLPSYATVRRFMRANGLFKRRRRGPAHSPGGALAERRLFTREVRSYECTHVHGLWHLDFHCGSRPVLTAAGQWVTPQLLAVIDDYSRLICHAQWYLVESAEFVVHGLSQAILRRGLPRALMTDRGGAMLAAEVVEGLARLSIAHDPTLPYSPDQNAKIESFWGRVEGRLMAMLEGEKTLTLLALNEATQAWVEREYHRAKHGETGELPIERFVNGPSVGRPSPSSADLRRAFLAELKRKQRRSDGTISLATIRFEIPSRYRHLRTLSVRAAAWDLSRVWLVDARTATVLAPLYPIDKQRNADGQRRGLEPVAVAETAAISPPDGIAPLLRRYLAEHAATGLPAPYLPTAPELDAKEPT
jgi:transposase InsO family protein